MLAWPLTVTVTATEPEPAVGVTTVSAFGLAAVTVPAEPPKRTVLALRVVLKPVPEIVTVWPAGPVLGETPVRVGTTVTPPLAEARVVRYPVGVNPPSVKPELAPAAAPA